MAVFKFFDGTLDDLKKVPFHEGYGYLIVDSYQNSSGTSIPVGKLYLDVVMNNTNQRVVVNGYAAEALLDPVASGSDFILPDELVKTTDINLFDGAVATTIQLLNANWSNGSQEITVSTLQCGRGGNVPPMVTYANSADKASYNKITSAEADPDTHKITFYADMDDLPADISLIVIDHNY